MPAYLIAFDGIGFNDLRALSQYRYYVGDQVFLNIFLQLLSKQWGWMLNQNYIILQKFFLLLLENTL